MRAIVLERYGPPEQLVPREVPTPVPRDGEVLVRVHAASINDWEWQQSQGEVVNRLLVGIVKPRRPLVIGCDIAGTVAGVGAGVTGVAVGDAVYGDLSMNGFGAFAEYVCVPDGVLGRKPESMTFEQAAAIPQAAMLAVQGLIDVGGLQPGSKLLLNGAGGGVGTFALQIARRYARVEITCIDSKHKLALLSDLGADQVLDYHNVDFTRRGERYDLILDPKTDRSPWHYLRALRPGGRYVTVGGRISRLIELAMTAPVIARVSDRRVLMVGLKPNKDLGYVNGLFEDGALRPVIDRIYSLDEVPDAFRYFGAAQQRGKLVVSLV